MAVRITLLRAFDQHWHRWRQGVTACQERPGRRAVHDLRVASRRLQSLFDLMEQTTETPQKPAERLAAAVASVLDALGPLRDAQNQRRRVTRSRPGPGIEALRRHLKDREARQEKRMRRALEEAGRPQVDKAAARLREAVASPAADQPGESNLGLAKAIDVAAAEVRNRLARFDLGRPHTVHRLRIALKGFRYVVEIATRLSPVLEVRAQHTVRALQDRLGRAHDAEVLIDRIDRFIRRHPAETAGLDATRRVLQADRSRQLVGLTRALAPLRRALTEVAERASSRRLARALSGRPRDPRARGARGRLSARPPTRAVRR